MRYTGHYNWQGEIHKLWTHGKNEVIAHKNFIAQMAKKLGFTNQRMRYHFNSGMDNHKIWEKEEGK